jgi:hypothetical protein
MCKDKYEKNMWEKISSFRKLTAGAFRKRKFWLWLADISREQVAAK